MQIKPFKIRCSKIGTLMSGTIGLTENQQLEMEAYEKRLEGFNKGLVVDGKKVKDLTANQKNKLKELQEKSKEEDLPKGVKTYLQGWLKEQLYERRKEFTSKYTKKGIEVEDEAIDYVVKVLDLGFAAKNTVRKENDYCNGECDIELLDEIIDTKAAWDCFTFPLFEDELDLSYWWQGQGYMWLYGKKKYKVAYCLMDAPTNIVMSEAWGKMKNYDMDFMTPEFYKKIEERNTYSDLPDYLRFKTFEFEYDEKAIEQIKYRVKLSRKYIETIIPKELQSVQVSYKGKPKLKVA